MLSAMSDVCKVAPTPLTKVQPRSIPSLDGMRGVAVLFVVAAHCDVPPRLVTKAGTARFPRGRSTDRCRLRRFRRFGVVRDQRILDHKPTDAAIGHAVVAHFLYTPLFSHLSSLFCISARGRLLWVAGAMPMLCGAFVSALLFIELLPLRLERTRGARVACGAHLEPQPGGAVLSRVAVPASATRQREGHLDRRCADCF